MANNEILIKIKAQTTQAVSALKGLGAALTALGIVEFGRRILFATAELVKFGLEVDAARTRLELTVGSAKAAEAYIRAVQDATNGAVDSFTAMNLALQASQYGFAQTPEQVAELSKNILILSNGNAELAQSFLYMASNGVGSIERLNEFGLSAAVVRQRMDELQAANEGMTRDAAFAEAVFAELDAKAEQLGGTMDTNAAKVRKFGAAVEELKVDAAEAAQEGFGAWVGIGEQLLAMFVKVEESGTRTENVFKQIQASAVGAMVMLSRLSQGMGAAEAIEAGREAYEGAALAMGAISTEASRAAAETEALALAQEAEAEASREQAVAAKIANAELLNSNKIVSELADETERLHRASTRLASDGLQGFDAITQGIADAGEAGQQGLKGLAAVQQGEDGKRYLEAFYQLAISDLDMSNPKHVAMALELKVAMGLATSQEVAVYKESMRLIELWRNGQLSSSQLASAAGAAATGNLGTLQGMQGSGRLDPNRPSAGGASRPPDLGKASSSGGAAQNINITLQLDGEVLDRRTVAVVSGEIRGASGGGPTRVGGSGGKRGAR
jgi:hypothetical protein